MKCQRCNFDFCWCCMCELGPNHNRWFSVCPNLPFSLCGNILFTLVVIILMPVLITFAALSFALYFSIKKMPKWIISKCRVRKDRKNRAKIAKELKKKKLADRYIPAATCSRCEKFLVYLLSVIFLLPISIAGCLLCGALSIIPSYYQSIVFLVRLFVAACRTKL